MRNLEAEVMDILRQAERADRIALVLKTMDGEGATDEAKIEAVKQIVNEGNK